MTIWHVALAIYGRLPVILRFPRWVLVDVPPLAPSEKLMDKTNFQEMLRTENQQVMNLTDFEFSLGKMFVINLGGLIWNMFLFFIFYPEPWWHDFILTNIFDIGWNHQLVIVCIILLIGKLGNLKNAQQLYDLRI